MNRFTLLLLLFSNLLVIPLVFIFGRLVFQLSAPYLFLCFVLSFGALNAAAIWGLFMARRDRLRLEEDHKRNQNATARK